MKSSIALVEILVKLFLILFLRMLDFKHFQICCSFLLAPSFSALKSRKTCTFNWAGCLPNFCAQQLLNSFCVPQYHWQFRLLKWFSIRKVWFVTCRTLIILHWFPSSVLIVTCEVFFLFLLLLCSLWFCFRFPSSFAGTFWKCERCRKRATSRWRTGH